MLFMSQDLNAFGKVLTFPKPWNALQEKFQTLTLVETVLRRRNSAEKGLCNQK